MFKQTFNTVKYVLWILIFSVGLYFLHNSLLTTNASFIIEAFKNQDVFVLAGLMLIGLLLVSFSTLYDFILCDAFKLRLDPKEIFKISWISDIALNFAENQEKRKGTLRYELYKSEGVDSKRAIYIASLSDLIFFRNGGTLPIAFELGFFTKVKLIGTALIKWTLTALFFVLIFKVYHIPFNIGVVIVTFVSCMFLGMLTLIPYGIGIFEVLALIIFQYLGYDFDQVLLVLINFRLFYSVIPWLITMLILAIGSTTHQNSKLTAYQKRLINAMSVKALAGLTFFAGSVLLLAATITERASHLIDIVHAFPAEIFSLIKVISIGTGLILIILSKGLWDKVRYSYVITLITLVLGSFLFLFEGSYLIVFLVLISIALALAPARSIFYRQGSVLKLSKWLSYFIPLLILTVLYFVLYNALTVEVPDLVILDLMILILFDVLGALLLTVLSVNRSEFTFPTDDDLEKLTAFLQKYEGNSMTHLLYLKDKCFFHAQKGEVLIAYRPYRDKMMVLGDPIGNPKLFKEAINEFRLFADLYDMTPVFYEISSDHLPAYHENGLKFLKLGEEAIVDLKAFSFAGKKGAPLRTIKNKMGRGEYTFELVKPPFTDSFLDELRVISDQWLEGRREKEFSLGSFDEAYLNLAPIATIKVEDQLVGFASIMPLYQKDTISIDLMRLIPNPPNGSMDALFIGLIEWAIAEDYSYFILGKAPLSNVGMNQFSTKKEKIAKYLYQYGNKIYSFKGLRKYKEKFYPEWHSVYLAYPKGTSLPTSLIQLTKVVSGQGD